MFDCSLYPADAIREVTDLRRKLVASKLDHLRRLGHGRDAEMLFWNGYCRPDWGLAEALGVDVGKIVREIFDLSHDVARAEDELELRARPN